MKQCSIAPIVIILIMSGLIMLCGCCSQNEQPTGPVLKAAIIDQLTPHYPNESFIKETFDELESYGFEVDLFNGKEVNIDLYRTLPQRGYKMIILRSHSGILGVDPEVVNKTWLFTNEEYDQGRYLTEQLTDSLTYGKINEESSWVFALSASFISNSMKGTFDNTVIIMMGCSGIYRTDLAMAFVDKGASFYIAWDGSVVLDYVDNATGVLIENLCSQGLSIGSATSRTMDIAGLDPVHGARLRHHPLLGDDLTLDQLLR